MRARRPPGQVLPGPGQDLVVIRLLSQLWVQPPATYPFRPLARMCAAWADEFGQQYAAAGPTAGSTRGWPKPGSRCSAATRHHGPRVLLVARFQEAGT